MIYVINGMSGSGKSTFCSFVKDIAGADYSVEFSTVDKVKEIAKMCGWDGKEKLPLRESSCMILKWLLTNLMICLFKV